MAKKQNTKHYSSAEYSFVSQVFKYMGKKSSSLKVKMENPASLDETIDIIVSKDYKKYNKKFGVTGTNALIDFYIDTGENYEECAKIKKATLL